MELGLALYIVSKRGRQVIFGQTGLLFANRQWGSNILNLNGRTQEITLPLSINYAAAAVATMRSGDFPGYVASPYWSECTKTTIRITPDYETGQGYAGTGQAAVTWILISFYSGKLYRKESLHSVSDCISKNEPTSSNCN